MEGGGADWQGRRWGYLAGKEEGLAGLANCSLVLYFLYAAKPAVSEETAKIWSLSAGDVLDDDIVR